MDGDPDRDGLRRGLESMVALESRLEETLALASAATEGYLEAATHIDPLRSLVAGQREALQAHMEELGDADVPPVGTAVSAALEPAPKTRGGEGEKTALGRLREVATAFTEAAFAYAALHALAHRFYHVATADLADRHRTNYLQAARAIHRAVGDVVVQGVLEAGHACRCQCPSCDPGVCLCWHVHAEPDASAPGAATEGIVVRAPRADSNAERAGLRNGDVILAVDGREIGSYQDMLDAMRAHEPGDDAELRVRRGTADPQELTLTR
ncbi:MAG: PDZ domain-containing protein [Actinobacteria bacterium]|nr:PDZ domain-containing protein [Actinomycetota bacterium]